MINNTPKTAIKKIIFLGILMLCTSILFLRKAPEAVEGPHHLPLKSKPKTVKVDGAVIESMVFLKNLSSNQQLLPWNEQDGYQSIRDFYITELKKHEDNLWQEATHKFGISRNAFKKEHNKRRYNFSNNNARRSGNLSPETIDLVEDVIKKCGLDPKTIEIIGQTEKTQSPATTTSKAIYVYEPRIKIMHPDAVRFIIAHETTHIKYQDGWARGIMKMLMPGDNIAKDQEKFLDTFGRFQETRADIEAVLCDPQYAQGGIEFFETLQKTLYCDTKVHPRNNDRISLCQTVTAMWQTMPLTHL